MTPKADEYRERVATLEAVGCKADQIALALRIDRDRVERILDSLHDVEHPGWYYEPAPALEPLRSTQIEDPPGTRRSGPGRQWSS